MARPAAASRMDGCSGERCKGAASLLRRRRHFCCGLAAEEWPQLERCAHPRPFHLIHQRLSLPPLAHLCPSSHRLSSLVLRKTRKVKSLTFIVLPFRDHHRRERETCVSRQRRDHKKRERSASIAAAAVAPMRRWCCKRQRQQHQRRRSLISSKHRS